MFLPPNNATQTFPWLSNCQLNRFHWNYWSLPSHPCISTFHLRVTLVTEIRFHLELPGGSTWKGDAIQDLALIGLFAGVGGHNIHIQTFPGFEMHEKQKNMEVAETFAQSPLWMLNTYYHLNFECILKQMFIRQTRYCSGVLKLSWAALKYVWEILLPAATWQRNPRMESAAAPFQLGHLWWHGRCTIIVSGSQI